MLSIGRICVKTNGKDAGKLCCVVDLIDKTFVLIDGNVKRKRCNIAHLEPLPVLIKIKKGEDTANVIKSMNAANIKAQAKKVKIKKPKEEKTEEKPKKETKKPKKK
jgi:large subunit ribosomal protein L14e